MASVYFCILYLPMLPRTAITLFGTVLRGAGDTRTPMKVGLITNIVNIVLNFLLIFPTRTVLGITIPGADMGVVGAATASAIAFTVGGLYITLVLWRHPTISPRKQRISPDGAILRPCLKIALPNMLQRFGTSLGYVAFASMVNSIGDLATAAHTIANTVESAFYIPGYGMQAAAATLAGNAYGAKNKQRLQDTAKVFVPLVIVLMVFSGGLLFAFAQPLMGLFSKSEEVRKLDLANFNTESVKDMTAMFHGLHKVKKLDLRSFNTANVKNMSCMFSDCFRLKKIVVDVFDTSNADDLSNMFQNCDALKEAPIESAETVQTLNHMKEVRFTDSVPLFL